MLEDLDNLLELWQLKSLSEDNKICCSLVPIGDLIQRALDGLIGWGVLVRDKLLNLTSPVDNCGLKSLKKIFVFSSSLNISEVLLWDVEVGLTFSKVCGLIQECHEPVKVCDEFFLHTIWPFVVLEQLLHVLGSHLLQEVIQRIHTDGFEHDAFIDVVHGDDPMILLHEVGNLVIL